MSEPRPIRTEANYERAMAELERLWGAPDGTPEGDQLDLLATLIDTYESVHYPMESADSRDAPPARH